MALDGITIANLVYELDETLREGHVQKIAQPEKDELLLTIKKNRINYKLMLSAGAAMPLVYLTDNPKPSPMTAPNFCMLLRKHLNGARILAIQQHGLERVIEITMENRNELGDLTKRILVIELMGKHSNIIFIDSERKVIDSIKHISSLQSSVRQVLPGSEYFIPNTQNKQDLLLNDGDVCKETVLNRPMSIAKAIYTSLTGISPVMAQEMAYEAKLDGDASMDSLSLEEKEKLWSVIEATKNQIVEHHFTPHIIMKGQEPMEFASLPLHIYDTYVVREYESVSTLLENYYGEKDVLSRIRQKSVDLRKITTTLLERNRKKLFLQEKQMRDTEKKDKYQLYGELLQTFGYQAAEGDKSITCTNYYDNQPITIPLDPMLSAMDNANRYFKKYNKCKRTFEALTVQLKETRDEIEHLESILNALDIARQENDLTAIKEELMSSGYLRRKTVKGRVRNQPKSEPLHFISRDGYDIYVGKNNYQNDQLTFKFANGGDWWFHAKQMAGSHVIVRCNGTEEPPTTTFEDAANLAAYFSKGRGSDKVEIDYTIKKNVKKPNGSKPGFVVYYTNYSMIAGTDLSGVKGATKEDQMFLEGSIA